MTEEQRDVFETLVSTLEEEFGVNLPLYGGEDDEGVMSGKDGDSPITFGMIRRARAALS